MNFKKWLNKVRQGVLVKLEMLTDLPDWFSPPTWGCSAHTHDTRQPSCSPHPRGDVVGVTKTEPLRDLLWK